MMVPERLTTARFVLTRFTRRDAEPLYQAVEASLPELAQWLPWAHPGYSRDDAAAFIRDSMQAWRDGKAYDYAIRDSTRPGRHIGNASIWHVSRLARTGEIGYWVRTDRTSAGVATEVTERMVRLGFEVMGLHKVTLRIAVGNRSSERVAEKLGFIREGVLREELLIRGRWVDHTLFSMLEHEWAARLTASGNTGV